MKTRALGRWAAVVVTLWLGLAPPAGAQRFVTPEQLSAGGVLPRTNDSILGFLQTVERFSFIALNPELQAAAGAQGLGTGFPQFRQFTDEARSTVDAVPIPSGSTSVAYTFDPALDVFVRWERPLAPLLSQNARTNGRNVLTFGAAFSHVDYKQFNDADLDQVVFPVGTVPVTLFDGRPAVARDVLLSDLDLDYSIYSFSAQFGVLDNLDVGVFVPVLHVRFKGRAIDRFFLDDGQGTVVPANVFLTEEGECCVFLQSESNPAVFSEVSDIDSSGYTDVTFPGIRRNREQAGFGDMILRTKYFVGSAGGLDLGFQLSTLLPTGDRKDLMGVGSVRFDPRVLVSTSTPLFAFHANAGYHADASEHDRDRVDYSVGGDVRIAPWATFLLDHVARMEIAGREQTRKFEIVPALKVNPWGDFVAGFGAIVPLNREGLTTDFTPTAVADVSLVF